MSCRFAHRAAQTAALIGALLLAGSLKAQTANPPAVPAEPSTGYKLEPFANPTISPGALELLHLEDAFEKSVEKGGGKAFASWFADDGVTLNNGQPAVRGRAAIAAHATWNPKDYQLTWYAEGAQMGPSSDTGFTWGHYEAHSLDAHGQPVAVSGRYITFWKKVHGSWKVALDASADDAPLPPLPQP